MVLRGGTTIRAIVRAVPVWYNMQKDTFMKTFVQRLCICVLVYLAAVIVLFVLGKNSETPAGEISPAVSPAARTLAATHPPKDSSDVPLSPEDAQMILHTCSTLRLLESHGYSSRFTADQRRALRLCTTISR